MIYRQFSGETVSQLGFGAMRLPMKGTEIDVATATQMIHKAIEAGINYFDTAWVYHGGKSEEILGQALKNGLRQKVFIATKSPVWDVKEPKDFPKFLDAQLQKLETDHIDFYLLHALSGERWDLCVKNEALAFLEKAKKEGKIRHFGFSYHDDPKNYEKVLKAYPWEFAQIQYNYMDRSPAQGQPGVEAPAAHGTSVVVMEPLRGGNLAGRMPIEVQKLWDSAKMKRTPAEWGLRWVWNHQEVGVVLSGMSSMEQLEENLKIADSAKVNTLLDEELRLIDKVEQTFKGLIKVPCTACRYCMPCPFGVDIPRNFGSYNEYFMFAENPTVRAGYKWIEEKERAKQCQECGACEPKCPQKIKIPSLMKEVAATFEA